MEGRGHRSRILAGIMELMGRWVAAQQAEIVVRALLLSLSGLAAFPQAVAAQSGPSGRASETVVGATVMGLVTIQPGDGSYVGEPYLDTALGGVGPGVGLGFTVISPRGFAAAAEFSTARVEVSQSGRLVGGHATGRIHDSMFTGLAGFGRSSRTRTVVILAGISRVVDSPSLNGVSIDQPSSAEGSRRIGFTAGVDVSQAATRRLAFVGNFRYSNIPRNTQAIQIGVGQHVFRVGAGVRVRVR
jgi:opacity protein-like surface antigen